MTKRPTTTAAATALKIKGELVLDGNTGLPLTPYEQGGVKVYPAGDFSPYGETVGVAADMTTPTPAQIEAAKRDLPQVASDICHPEDSKKWLQLNWELLNAALTAAAEVGEQDPAVEWVERVKHFEAADRQLKNATIERCAQVADHYEDKPEGTIAAAIRALRDKA